MNLLRWLLIALANTIPSKFFRRKLTLLCSTIVPAYPEEDGGFRSDIALCAFGLLRYGDFEGFEYWVAKYPFRELWMGFNKKICVVFIQGRWRVFSWFANRRLGRVFLPRCPHQHISQFEAKID